MGSRKNPRKNLEKILAVTYDVPSIIVKRRLVVLLRQGDAQDTLSGGSLQSHQLLEVIYLRRYKRYTNHKLDMCTTNFSRFLVHKCFYHPTAEKL